MRKTKRMLVVEENFGESLENLIPTMINERGLNHSQTAAALGVSKATFGYWNLKLGIQLRYVALRPGEIFEVKLSR